MAKKTTGNSQVAAAAAISSGRSPVVEPGVSDLLEVGHAEGRLSVASQIDDEIEKLDLVDHFVCNIKN